MAWLGEVADEQGGSENWSENEGLGRRRGKGVGELANCYEAEQGGTRQS